ncbi:putative serine esterase-domain-containing protein [Aspergillus coremiiformis]|uniref:Putative serine esterase-domain-containing protein n=1 Tax=Aspergillus coremiiformis TaxID=138285 RepID=A0A5N6YWE0_9EURO|nr:putative serine esterase-domain-containing protein [Aspergillus coremiiformis]
MLISPRTYSASQVPDRGQQPCSSEDIPRFRSSFGWSTSATNSRRAAEMLLIHQTGSVRVGEVVRYTVTYTPAADTAGPIPAELYVKVKNTSAIPLRAAYLHGPYTLYTSCYPIQFDPNVKLDQQVTQGIPQFEPYLKAGGSWSAVITVPRRLRQNHEIAFAETRSHQKVTWVIEIVSQVVFSSTASVNFELLVGRDQKSVELFFTGGASTTSLPQAAQLSDHWSLNSKGQQVAATNGVYSRSITLLIDDTMSLWNTPTFPSSDSRCEARRNDERSEDSSATNAEAPTGPSETIDQRQSNMYKKKIHLVVLTHGLHSNLGADMLYLKESIDAAARKTKQQAAKACRDEQGSEGRADDEQVVVRGFPGNAVRTERGIQYLGKRLAKYVLLMTYPDQPCNPYHNTRPNTSLKSLALWKTAVGESSKGHVGPDVLPGRTGGEHAYQVTSISFIGHSLGGLIQTYAIAYIQKHSPKFFDAVRPVNFIALATPFLGLSNENPMYVRFALDLGLVGRTGQDLGLSWTAPRVRSGWEAIIGGKGSSTNPQGHSDAVSKPLLRILPCGPAHEVLAKFQHRTIYSNVVNDGIVPLRTSCLLFLDWRGLERVEKARRENGIVGTVAEWGWAELTGANSKSPRTARSGAESEWKDTEESNKAHEDTLTTDMPLYQAAAPATALASKLGHQPPDQPHQLVSTNMTIDAVPGDNQSLTYGPLSNLLSMFRPKDATRISPGHKQTKMLKRSQTLGTSEVIDGPLSPCSPTQDSFADSPLSDEHMLYAPPKTTLFESASDLLMPPLPPIEFIIDPTSRPRTIFHDRIYKPEDIPPPLTPKRRTLAFGSSQHNVSKNRPSSLEESPHHGLNESESGLKIEEKIARAYHRNLTWRKVLVRLEPDAHNNIIVRRMFTNAYGWPVVKHLVDTHFGYTSAAQSKDDSSKGVEKAKSPTTPTSGLGEVQGQNEPPMRSSTSSREFTRSPILGVSPTDQGGFI